MKSVDRPINDPIPEDSGPGGVVIVTIVASGRRKQFSFRSPSVQTIGSDEGCEIRIVNAEGIAPSHARFVWMNGWLVLEDLGSTDGTWMQARAVERSVMGAGMRHTLDLGRSKSVTATVLVSPNESDADSGSENDPFAAPAARASTAVDIRTTQWKDLPPTWPVPGTYGRNPAHKLILKLLESYPNGATLEELDARLTELGDRRTNSIKLLGWLHDYRGWGFRMDAETGRISVWSYLQYNASSSVERQRTEAIRRERQQLEEAKRALRQQQEQLERRLLSPDPVTPSSHAVLADWRLAIPEPDRAVFEHIAKHGQINEAEATTILGGPRQFRRFSMNFERLAMSCPFKVRIESSGHLKTYVRDERVDPTG